MNLGALSMHILLLVWTTVKQKKTRFLSNENKYNDAVGSTPVGLVFKLLEVARFDEEFSFLISWIEFF